MVSQATSEAFEKSTAAVALYCWGADRRKEEGVLRGGLGRLTAGSEPRQSNARSGGHGDLETKRAKEQNELGLNTERFLKTIVSALSTRTRPREGRAYRKNRVARLMRQQRLRGM